MPENNENDSLNTPVDSGAGSENVPSEAPEQADSPVPAAETTTPAAENVAPVAEKPANSTETAAPAVEAVAPAAETTAPTEGSKKKKSKVWIIVLVAILALAATVTTLQLTGVIKIQSLFGEGKSSTDKNSYGGTGYGMYGGASDDSTTPTPKAAQAVCEEAGGSWKKIDASNLRTGDSEYEALVEEAYSCMTASGEDVTDKTIAFRIVYTSKEFGEINYYKTVIESNTKYFDKNGGSVLEQSENYYKAYRQGSSSAGYTQFSYMAVYRKAAVELMAVTTDNAERVLVALGFPDRSYAPNADGASDTNSSSSSDSNRTEDAVKKRVLTKEEAEELDYYNNQYAATGLVDYLRGHNDTYPDITGYEGATIDGTGTTALDDFYNDYIVNGGYVSSEYGYTDRDGKPVRIRFYSSPNTAVLTDHVVTIHLNTRCYDEDTRLEYEPGYFAVTYLKTSGGFYCDTRGRGEYHK